MSCFCTSMDFAKQYVGPGIYAELAFVSCAGSCRGAPGACAHGGLRRGVPDQPRRERLAEQLDRGGSPGDQRDVHARRAAPLGRRHAPHRRHARAAGQPACVRGGGCWRSERLIWQQLAWSSRLVTWLTRPPTSSSQWGAFWTFKAETSPLISRINQHSC